jgi:DNA-binding MarR family transcriptional regulator
MEGLPDEIFLTEDDGSTIRRTLNLATNPMALLVFAANRHSRNSARYYHRRLGIRATDYRILVILTAEPNSSVTSASEVIGIDKAAVSRSLQRLEAQRYVTSKTPGSNTRHRLWRLTAKGNALHDKVLALGLERQRQHLKGFTAEDVKNFSGMLRLIMKNLRSEETDAEDDEL